MAKLRAGRKKVTTSFTLSPEIHTWFKQRYPNHGDRTRVFEQLLLLLKEGKVSIDTKPVVALS